MNSELLQKILDKYYSINPIELSQEQLDEYRSFPLLKQLNVTDEEFVENFVGIKRIVDEQKACDQLIDRCVNSPSYHLTLVREDNKLSFQSVYCPKMKKINARREFAKNYLYRSFSNNFLDLSLTKKFFYGALDPTKIDLIRKFLNLIKQKEFNYGFYIYGPFGVGKTYTTIAFANDLARINKKISYCFLPDLVFNLKQGFDDKEKNSENLKTLKSLREADVLFLDDIGAEKTNAWFYSEHLMIILNARMQKNKPTFFTSNLSLDELQKKLVLCCGTTSGNRLFQRIIGVTNNQTFKLEGINLRTSNK